MVDVSKTVSVMDHISLFAGISGEKLLRNISWKVAVLKTDVIDR
jgi:hypothetical protein